MIFRTLSFLIFFLCVWPAAWLPVVMGRHRLHKLAVVAASYVFYAFWSVTLTAVLFGCVVASWAAGRGIALSRTAAGKRVALALGIGANLAALAFFKYYGWFSQDLNALLAALGLGARLPLLDIVLPIGISFYTLQG